MKTGTLLPRALCLMGGSLLLGACGILYSPDNITFIEGEHVVIYYHTDTATPERCDTLAGEADQAWLEVLEITDLLSTAAPRIFIADEGSSLIATGWSDYYMIDNTVHLSSSIFSHSVEYRASMLRHELTHLAVYAYYGLSESFILAEGIAEYAEYSGDYPHIVKPADRWTIQTALPLGIDQSMQGGSALPESLSHLNTRSLYNLAGSFATYIIETYSVEMYLQLYRNFDRSNPDTSYRDVTGHTLEEMHDEFYHFGGAIAGSGVE